MVKTTGSLTLKGVLEKRPSGERFLTKPNPKPLMRLERVGGWEPLVPYPTEPRAKEARGKTPVSKTENCSGAGGWEKRKAPAALLRSAQPVPAGATSLQNSEGRVLN